jgi:hypothetical protein
MGETHLLRSCGVEFKILRHRGERHQRGPVQAAQLVGEDNVLCSLG